MMFSTKTRYRSIVQAAFIVSLLGASAAHAAAQAPTTDGKPAPAAVDTTGPSQLIESSANIMLSGIDKRRAEFRKDPTGLYQLVEQTLLPNFDTPYAAQLVLGQHWRSATPEQRDRFVKAFYQSLLYTYGDAMVDFTGDRLKVLPTKVTDTDTKATVRTEIKRSNGTKVPVSYSMRKVNGQWKAWDVVIEGISYVKSYREDYGAEVAQKGLDSVIARLEAKAQSAKAAKGQTPKT
jgi:phospholipid transport system substrate-binding protein